MYDVMKSFALVLSCRFGQYRYRFYSIFFRFLPLFLSLREITLNLIIITKSLSLIKVNRQKKSDTLNSSLTIFIFIIMKLSLIELFKLLEKRVYAISSVCSCTFNTWRFQEQKLLFRSNVKLGVWLQGLASILPW